MEKAKELSVEYFSFEGATIRFPSAFEQLKPEQKITSQWTAPLVPNEKAEVLVKPLSVLDEMSPEEILYYATPYYDEIQGQKAEHEAKLKEEKI